MITHFEGIQSCGFRKTWHSYDWMIIIFPDGFLAFKVYLNFLKLNYSQLNIFYSDYND